MKKLWKYDQLWTKREHMNKMKNKMFTVLWMDFLTIWTLNEKYDTFFLFLLKET